MLYALLAVHGIILPFVFFQVRAHRLSKWCAVPCFYVMAIGIILLSFSFANAVLMQFAADDESVRWFRDFAIAAATAGAAVAVITAGLAMFFRKSLLPGRIFAASVLVFAAGVGLLLLLARVPQMNWW